MRSSSGCTLPLLINLERGDEIKRALQNRVARRLLFAPAVASLRIRRIELGLRPGQQCGLVQVLPLRFVNSAAVAKSLPVLARRSTITASTFFEANSSSFLSMALRLAAFSAPGRK